MIVEPASGTRAAVLEGWEVEGQAFTIYALGVGTAGRNLLPLLYHGNARTPQDICTQCGLSGQADVTRFDGMSGQVLTHVCGQTPTWSLALGDAVMIREPGGPRTCVQPHH